MYCHRIVSSLSILTNTIQVTRSELSFEAHWVCKLYIRCTVSLTFAKYTYARGRGRVGVVESELQKHV
jgi:hypothetical protein